MKTIKLFLAALVVSTAAVSCSSGGDDGNSTGGDLTAKWNEVKTVQKVSGETYTYPYDENQAGCAKDYIEFTDAGFLNRAVYVMDVNNNCAVSAADPVEYQRTNNTLVIANGPYAGTFQIKKLTDTQLTIQTDETVGSTTTTYIIYFTKAAM